MKKSKYVGVIGAGACPRAIHATAEAVGAAVGIHGWTLVCGGLGGVMAAASKGCFEAGGVTVGILPGLDRDAANPHIRIPIPTGLGEGRNLLVVRASDIIIAISGGYGTLSEISLALKTGKPVIGIYTWANIEGICYVADAQEAVYLAKKLLQAKD